MGSGPWVSVLSGDIDFQLTDEWNLSPEILMVDYTKPQTISIKHCISNPNGVFFPLNDCYTHDLMALFYVGEKLFTILLN